MHHDARYDAAGAVVHPSQEQAQTEGVGHLSGVHVDEGEEQGRHHDGHPVAAHTLKQCAQDGSPEDQFLYQRGEDADAQVSPAVRHDFAHQLAVDVGQGHQFEKHFRGDDGSQCRYGCPQEHAEGAGAQVVGRHHAPFPPKEDDEGDDAVDSADDDEHGCRHLQRAVGEPFSQFGDAFAFGGKPCEEHGIGDHKLYHEEDEQIEESVDNPVSHNSKSFSNNSIAFLTSSLICRASSPGEAKWRSSRSRWAKFTTSRSP